MGNSQSENLGYRIVKVVANSPGDQAGLIPFFDFITGIDSPSVKKEEIISENLDFFTILSRSENVEITLKIYNIQNKYSRSVKLAPNKSWENADSLLGVMIRPESYLEAREKVFRISNVQEYSPAKQAGLVNDEDYLLGITQTDYKDLEELINYFLNSEQNSLIKSLELCIYNSVKREIRFAYIMPNKNWGGKGCIGCEFSTGYLNELPWLGSEEECYSVIYPRLKKDGTEEMRAGSYQAQEQNTTTTSQTTQVISPPPKLSEVDKDKTAVLHYSNEQHETAESTAHFLAEKRLRRKQSEEYHHKEVLKNPFNLKEKSKEEEETEIIEFHFDQNQIVEEGNSESPLGQIKERGVYSAGPSTTQRIQSSESLGHIPISIEKRGVSQKSSAGEFKFECKKLDGLYVIHSDELFDLSVTLHKQI